MEEHLLHYLKVKGYVQSLRLAMGERKCQVNSKDEMYQLFILINCLPNVNQPKPRVASILASGTYQLNNQLVKNSKI